MTPECRAVRRVVFPMDLPVLLAGWQASRVLQGVVCRADTDAPLAGTRRSSQCDA